jgi:glycosyltransferase involved in cell wall biosynthesis
MSDKLPLNEANYPWNEDGVNAYLLTFSKAHPQACWRVSQVTLRWGMALISPHTPQAVPSDSPVILQVLPALKDGGVESSAIEMAHYTKEQGWQPIVASAGGSKSGLLAAAAVPHLTLPLASKSPWIILGNAVRLARFIRAHNVALVHARSRAPAWSAWLASRWTGVPFITTFHGTYGLSGGWVKHYYNSVMVRGPRVIANSLFIRNHIIENYDISPDLIDVATRGVDPEVWNPALFDKNAIAATRAEIDVPEGVPLILMAGRITKWKGHDLVLEALGQLSDLPWWLAVVGAPDKNGAYALRLKARADQLGIADRIRWLGSRTDLPRLLAASQIALSGSTQPEAFGRVAIEAMAMGVPVVATGHGGSLETVRDGETGWLVMPEQTPEAAQFGAFTPQAFARILRGALQNPKQLATMGKAARAHVLGIFTVERCCAAEMQAYRKVLGLDTPSARTNNKNKAAA